ncbi:hypothetical protein ACOMHN_046423 [Nucella lapillus]
MAEEGHQDADVEVPKYLEFKSLDSFSFYLPLSKATEASSNISAMVNNPGEQPEEDYVYLPYPSHVVNQVCQYIMFKTRLTAANMAIPEFNVNPEDAVFLLDAAMYLDL